MNKKLLKALSTITLSLVLATSTIAGTVLATENQAPKCDHPLQTETRGTAYEPANSVYHWATPYVRVTCDDCGAEVDYYEIDNQTVYEEHNLIGSADGYYWVCVDCDAHIVAGTK